MFSVSSDLIEFIMYCVIVIYVDRNTVLSLTGLCCYSLSDDCVYLKEITDMFLDSE